MNSYYQEQIIRSCLSIHSENTGGVFLIINREPTPPEDAVRMHFATYGDPVFEDLLVEFRKHDLPKCTFRLMEKVPEIGNEVVAYAVACINRSGEKDVRLITSCNDLKEVTLDESVDLCQVDFSKLRKELHLRVRREFDPARSVPRLEKENQRAGCAQKILNLMVGKSLLDSPVVEDTDLFSAAIGYFDQLMQERDRLIVSKIPADILREIQPDLLFQFPVPQVGEETSPTLPIFLVVTALDTSCRIANTMKVAGASLTVDAVKRRLEREANHNIRRYRSLL